MNNEDFDDWAFRQINILGYSLTAIKPEPTEDNPNPDNIGWKVDETGETFMLNQEQS